MFLLTIETQKKHVFTTIFLLEITPKKKEEIAIGLATSLHVMYLIPLIILNFPCLRLEILVSPVAGKF